MTERLYRHPTDRAIAGVAGGMAVWLDIDPSLVRIAWVLLAIFSGGHLRARLHRDDDRGAAAAPGLGAPPTRGGPGTGLAAGVWWLDTARWPASRVGSDRRADAGLGYAWQRHPRGSRRGRPALRTRRQAGRRRTARRRRVAPLPRRGAAPKAGNAGIVAGVILIGLGVWFLVDQFIDVNWDLLWPVVIMVVGGALIAGALMRGRSS